MFFFGFPPQIGARREAVEEVKEGEVGKKKKRELNESKVGVQENVFFFCCLFSFGFVLFFFIVWIVLLERVPICFNCSDQYSPSPQWTHFANLKVCLPPCLQESPFDAVGDATFFAACAYPAPPE